MKEKISQSQAKEIAEIKAKCEALMETSGKYKQIAIKMAVLTIASAVMAFPAMIVVSAIEADSQLAGQNQVDTQAK